MIDGAKLENQEAGAREVWLLCVSLERSVLSFIGTEEKANMLRGR